MRSHASKIYCRSGGGCEARAHLASSAIAEVSLRFGRLSARASARTLGRWSRGVVTADPVRKATAGSDGLRPKIRR